jgi:hypothetical protein
MKGFLFVIFLTITLFSSCVALKQENLVGKYKGATPTMGSFVPASQMELYLKPDETFILYWLHVNYTGKWSLSDKKCILLEFDKIIDEVILLRSGTITDKELVLKVIKSNKLKYERYSIILKKWIAPSPALRSA